jgi:hypothetical protein
MTTRSHRPASGPGMALLIASLLLTMLVSDLPAQKKKPAAAQAAKSWPDVKTLEDKLMMMEIIRRSLPMTKTGRTVRYTSADLDDELERYISRETQTDFAPVIDNETFIRRVTLDLTGQVPSKEQIAAFVANESRTKRSDLVDQLLETDDYARKWARYWRSVIFQDSNANRNAVNPQALEDWFAQAFAANARWDQIVARLVFASPQRQKNTKPEENGWEQDTGPNNFVLACERKPEEIASRTARIFMGISIQCAECHDHPFDDWKREQFHELAAFFAPYKYYMTGQDDPSQKSEMQAKFLLGETPPSGLKADQRRVAVAAYLIYNPDNYWFARAYVNRIWNEMMGDGFYAVDSLGADKEVLHKLVVNRLAANFRFAEFDPKWAFRIIANSRFYQREIRTIDDPAEYFTGVRPTRLRPYEVVDNVTRLTGENPNLQRQLAATFDQDLSIPQRNLEGSIQQALLMMNNGTLQGKLAGSELKKELAGVRDNKRLVTDAFLGVLARTPTDEEITRYSDYLKRSANRSEAIDDILWVLVNSAEFLAKR